MSPTVILINVFEVSVDQEQEFIAWWKQCSDVLKEEPGFLDATLHRSLKPDARFQFINLAHWETAESLNLALAQNQELLQSLHAWKGIPALYEVALRY
jgi:heme oxygenase (mycobilin-producing)